MYKLMIADDEFLSRFVIKSLIQKKFPDIDIVAEPENGRQAIEYGLKLKPDIIIMDIRMPGLNGIEASKVILNEYPNTLILILTAYDKFDYVKEALDIGIKGFILKPINEMEVIQNINRIIGEIEKRERHVEQEDFVEEKIRTVRPLIENELVSAFITSDFDAEKIERYSHLLKENHLSSGYFMLITPSYSYIRQKNRQISFRRIRESIYDIASSHPSLMNKCLFSSKMGSTVVVFHTVEDKKSDITPGRDAQTVGIGLAKRIKTIAGIDTAIGIGNVHTGYNNLCKSYNEANLALKRALKTGALFITTELKQTILFLPILSIQWPLSHSSSNS